MITKKPRKKSPPQIKVIDKFLPTNELIAIKDIFKSGNCPWYLGHGISDTDNTNAILNPLDNYYFAHVLYFNYMQTSEHFTLVKETVEKLYQNILELALIK